MRTKIFIFLCAVLGCAQAFSQGTGSASSTGKGGNSLGRWHIAGIENFPHTKVAIYSRSGRLLWEGMAYTDETGWDGTYQGNSLPSTDYWYVISSEECDRVLSGHLTLLNSGNR